MTTQGSDAMGREALAALTAMWARPAVRALIGLLALMATGCSDGGADFECAYDADCAAKDDGDPCNGGMRCEPKTRTCVADPSTAVTCDDKDDTACVANRCDPTDGACKPVPRNQGVPCDDGEPCTLGDTCDKGSCVPGTTELCACRADADCSDDADKCNGTPVCDKSAFPYRCVADHKTVVVCKDPGACLSASCDAKTGKCASTPDKDGAACDDGDSCTQGDTCDKGNCSGTPAGCGCTMDSDCADLDADLCTGVPYCDTSSGKGVCKNNPSTVVTCSTAKDTACIKSQCAPKTGVCALAPVKDDTACDDGDPCTKGEVCVAGTCAAGTDTCACTKDADCEDDGDLCNGLPFCNKATGGCEHDPTKSVVCPSVADTACAKNVCEPKTGKCAVVARSEAALVGCVDVNLGGVVGKQCLWKKAAKPGAGPFVCDDGSACTSGDVCSGKACKPGKVVCECTADADCAGKDDGDLCNGTLFCDTTTGSCKANPSSVVYCSKAGDSDCLKNTCDPKTAKCSLQPVKTGAACDDGAVCTVGETCNAAGACVGKKNPCDDGKACTVDTCAKGVGCKHTPVVCDDGNVCTQDACDPKSGKCAVPSPLSDKVQCDADGSGCTVGDHCDGKGACMAGAAASCPAASAPCQQSTCKSVSPSKFECVVTAQANGSPCDDGDPCYQGAVCSKGVCKPGDKSTLWLRQSGFASGQTDIVGLQVQASGDILLVRSLGTGQGATWWAELLPAATGLKATTKALGKPSSVSALGAGVALLDLGQSGALAVGPATASGVVRTALLSVGATGDAGGWTLVDNGASGSVVPVAAALHGSGNVVVLEKAAGDHRVRMLTPGGKPVWSTVSDLYSTTTLSARLAVDASGQIFAYRLFGKTGLNGSRSVAALSASGKLLWRWARNYPSQPQAIAGLRVAKDGRLEALSAEPGGAAWWSSFAAADGSPGLVDHALESDFAPRDAVPYLGGMMALGASDGSDALAFYDAHGNRQWLRVISSGAQTTMQRLAVDPARQRVVVAGATKSGTQSQRVVRTLSVWGETTCGSRGACKAKGLAACDDNKACTADSCSPLVGCVHTPPKSAVCPLSTGCSPYGQCEAGQCAEPVAGRLFAKSSDAIIAPYFQSKGRVSAVPGKAQGTLWAFRPDKGGMMLISYTADLGDGALSFSGPPNIRCPTLDRVDGLERRADGTVVVVGHAITAYGSKTYQRATVCYAKVGWSDVGIGADTVVGTEVPLSETGCAGCDQEVRALALHTNGDVFVGLDSEKSGGSAQLWRLDESFKVTGGSTTTGSQPMHLNGVAVTGLGSVIAVGWSGKDQDTGLPLFIRRTSKWVIVANVTLDSYKGGELYDVAIDADYTNVAVGTWRHNPSARSSLVVALDGKGKVLWTHLPSVPDQRVFKAVQLLGDGYVAVGSQIVGGPEHMAVARRDNAGTLLWSRTHALPTGASIDVTRGNLVKSPLGTWLIGARNNAKEPMWAHMSRHGFLSCKAAGGCTAASKTCDDKNPCTADWCDAKAGCQHQPLSGLSCGTQGTCQAGSCK